MPCLAGPFTKEPKQQMVYADIGELLYTRCDGVRGASDYTDHIAASGIGRLV
jgi:hypothetical protein